MPDDTPTAGLNESLFGHDLFGEPVRPVARNVTSQRFIVPPFSLLSARDGEWMDRKRAWLSLGIKSELGRKLALLSDGEGNSRQQAASLAARYGVDEDKLANGGSGIYSEATSIFDPCLAELAVRWWCPAGGIVLDPFAGGSVRGIVTGALGRTYLGVDLRPEQVEANRAQAEAIAVSVTPTWFCGDAMDTVPSLPRADFILTCPPYGDLEQYSDDPRDLSTMEYHTFTAAFGRILLRCAERLRDDRFMCLVVGDFRDAAGLMRGFVADTVQLCRNAGLGFYNEAIYLTPCGSLPIRITRQFSGGRKLGKTHQNVLVFVKGSPVRAARACEAFELGDAAGEGA